MSFYNCKHTNTSTGYDHCRCSDCGGYCCDHNRSWGPARGKWFKNESLANFYKDNGFLPNEELQKELEALKRENNELKASHLTAVQASTSVIGELNANINKLLAICDDIDTAGDMFKPEITAYFKYVNRKCREAQQLRGGGLDEAV